MFSLATTDKAVDVSLVDAKADEAVGKSSSAGWTFNTPTSRRRPPCSCRQQPRTRHQRGAVKMHAAFWPARWV